MKPLDLNEVQQIVIDLQTLVGAQLQEVFQSGSNIALGFYHDRSIQWLWFDLNPRSPSVVRLDQIPKSFKKEIKPLTLFIRSHFTGSRLKQVSTSPELGRVFEMKFANSVLQARIFPRGQNFIATAEEKSVSFDKVKDLQSTGPTEIQTPAGEPRSWQEIEDEWKRENKIGATLNKPATEGDAVVQAEKQYKKDLEKKEKALSKMKEDLLAKQNPIFREAGEYLKTLSHNDFPQAVLEKFRDAIDSKSSLSKNIESLFKKAKDNERKLEGSKERIAKLEEELNDLRLRGPSGHLRKVQTTQSGAKKKTLLEAAAAKGRKFQISEDLEVYIGKSAGDNLALLRRAQPFDYWLHLRDYPGTHAIMRRTRNRIVTDEELQQVGKWVVQQSLHKNPEQLSDMRFDVLLVECRYVRPIKGDKLGRVNYSNDRVFVVRF